MLLQILIGTGLVVATVLVSAVLLGMSLEFMPKVRSRVIGSSRTRVKAALFTGAMSLFVVAVMTLVTWVWAIAFYGLGIFKTIEESLYFSIVSFTTLGFGDVIPPEEWRLLSGFIAMDGFILFGLCAAYLFDVLSSLHKAPGDAGDTEVDTDRAAP